MKKPRIVTKNGLIAAVDVGSSKICCFIARLADDGKPNVVGIGHQISRGVRQGAIIDMEQAEMAVLSTVHAAEQMAGETITDVVINLSGGYPASQTIGVEVPLSGREIGDHDLQRVLMQGAQINGGVERRLIHSIPVGYTIDGSRGIRDPRGMFGAGPAPFFRTQMWATRSCPGQRRSGRCVMMKLRASSKRTSMS